MTNDLAKRIRLISLAVACGLMLLQLLVIAIAVLQTKVPIRRLFRDMAQTSIMETGCCNYYDGAISQLGVLLWAATVSICAITFIQLVIMRDETRSKWVFAAAAAFTAVLMLDDQFLFHELVIPSFGVSEVPVHMAYIAFAIGYVLFSARWLARAQPVTLGLAVISLATGLVIDNVKDLDLFGYRALLEQYLELRLTVEDGTKFLGAGFWFSAHLGAALDAMSGHPIALAKAKFGFALRAG